MEKKIEAYKLEELEPIAKIKSGYTLNEAYHLLKASGYYDSSKHLQRPKDEQR